MNFSKIYFLQVKDQIGQANPRSQSKSLEECRKHGQLFQSKFRVLTTGQPLSPNCFLPFQRLLSWEKNHAQKIAAYRWGRENTSEKKKVSNVSGRGNFLDYNSEWFLDFHVSDHMQQGKTAKHLACVIYSWLKEPKPWEPRAHLRSCATVGLKSAVKMIVFRCPLLKARHLQVSVHLAARMCAGVLHALNCHCHQFPSPLQRHLSHEPNEQSDSVAMTSKFLVLPVLCPENHRACLHWDNRHLIHRLKGKGKAG